MFLTSLVDPQGQALQFTWDAQFRLVAVTDAIGQVTTLTYGDSVDPSRITRVTDPFARLTTLQYTAEGQLASITDVIGITSSFVYGAGDFVARLTTPYGTTAFRHEADWTNLVHARMVEATDPFGETEHLEFEWKTSTLPVTVPASEVPTGFDASNPNMDHYNTFYWDKRAWKTAPGDKTQALVTPVAPHRRAAGPPGPPRRAALGEAAARGTRVVRVSWSGHDGRPDRLVDQTRTRGAAAR